MNAVTKVSPTSVMLRASDLPPDERYTGYFPRSIDHADKFNPFEPDPLGALREAYAFISDPLKSFVVEEDGRRLHRATYDTAHYNELTAMIRLALRRAA